MNAALSGIIISTVLLVSMAKKSQETFFSVVPLNKSLAQKLSEGRVTTRTERRWKVFVNAIQAGSS